MKILHHILLFGIVGTILHGNLASAHSFNLIFIAPLSDSTGQSALDGFLLATTEQDSHEFETSDGHLGGLDSHVFRIDSSTGNAMVSDRLEKTIDGAKPLFAAGLLPDANLIELLKNSGAVYVDPASSPFWRERLARREQLTTMDGGLFFAAFERAYGYRPDDHAIRSYLVARVIADVVRNSSEQDRSQPDILERMVGEALMKPFW